MTNVLNGFDRIGILRDKPFTIRRNVIGFLTILFGLVFSNIYASAFEPDFVFPLENVTIAQGRDATFTCVVNNLGGYRVSGDTALARKTNIEFGTRQIGNSIGEFSKLENGTTIVDALTSTKFYWLHSDSEREGTESISKSKLFGSCSNSYLCYEYSALQSLTAVPKSALLGAEVAWIKADAKAILAIHEHVITNNDRLSVTHNDYNTWTLVIRNVKMEDRGQYMCQVNTDPMKMQTAFLEVVIPPDIIYEETSGDMMVPEGSSAKLICKARGFPKPKVTWRREDGREIIARNGSHGKTKALVVEGEMLWLSKVTRSEMGAYLCIASNGVPPSVSKRMKLQVHFHPLIQVPNQLVGAPVGTDVTLVCNAEASPKAINYWQRENGEMIIPNDRYSMTETDNSMYAVQMVLIIKKLQKTDFGGYKCISKNSIGGIEATIRLYEMELSKKPKHQRINFEDGPNEESNNLSTNEEFNEDGLINKNGRLYKGLQTGEADVNSKANTSQSRSSFLFVFVILVIVYPLPAVNICSIQNKRFLFMNS